MVKNNLNIFTFTSILLTISLFTSCASIFGFPKQAIRIHTPQESTEVILDTLSLGKGEKVKARVRKDGVAKIVLKQEGYKDMHHVLIPHHRSVGFWLVQIPNLLSFGLANGIDFYNDKNIRYKRHQHFEHESFPLPYRDEKLHKVISLDSILIGHDSSTDNFLIAVLNYSFNQKILKKKMRKAEEEALEEVQRNLKYRRHSSKSSLYNISNFKERTKDDFNEFAELIGHGKANSIDDKSTLHIDCELSSSVKFHFDCKNDNAFQKLRLNCLWNIKDANGNRIKTIETTAWSGDFLTNESEMVSDALIFNFMQLLEDTEFKPYLKQ